jgi:hypothetical protein
MLRGGCLWLGRPLRSDNRQMRAEGREPTARRLRSKMTRHRLRSRSESPWFQLRGQLTVEQRPHAIRYPPFRSPAPGGLPSAGHGGGAGASRLGRFRMVGRMPLQIGSGQ